jgi:hypothetical protein
MRTLGGVARLAHELHVPLLQAGEVFGVLSLGRLGDVPFEQADVQLVSHLADQSAVALSKSVVLRELRRRDTITRAVLDATPDPIALLDDGGHPVVANEPMRLCLPLLRERPVPEVEEGVVRDRSAIRARATCTRATSRASTSSTSTCAGASSCCGT